MAGDLVIGRLEVDLGPRSWTGEEREAKAIVADMVDRRLQRAMSEVSVPEGEWCLRRIVVEVEPSGAVRPRSRWVDSEAWSQALARAVQRAIATGGDDVVYYRDLREALVDLVTGCVTGRTERAWAWHQVGLVDHDSSISQSEGSPTGAGVVAALSPHPELALGVVIEVADAGGLASLDRALDIHGWRAIVGLVGGPALVDAAGREPGSTPGLGRGRQATRDADPSRASEIVATSHLASAVATSPLRLDQDRRRAVGALCLLEAAPHLALTDDLSPGLDRLLDAVAEELAGAEPSVRPPSAAGPMTPVEGDEADAGPTEGEITRPGEARRPTYPAPAVTDPSPSSVAVPSVEAAPSDRPAPDPTSHNLTRSGAVASEWAGLLFLLGVIDRLGLVERLPAQLAQRPIRWVLYHLAAAMVPLPDGDPARRAFCGMSATSGSLGGHRPPTLAEADALDRLASEVRAPVQEAAVAAARSRTAATTDLCRRHGLVVVDPGWVEVHLPLSSVEPWVRAGGLDLDPGWLPWLGVVVRIVYV